jgi:hypothetical protein
LLIQIQNEISERVASGSGGTTNALSLLDWAKRNRAIDGEPFSLERHKPLIQIYNDEHPHKVVIKPAQVGLSEYAVTFVCWLLSVAVHYLKLEKLGLNVGYLFPTQTALSDFSKERFGQLRQESLTLQSLFTDYDDVGFKQAGDSFLYLRGAWSINALKSFPADVLIYDEFDEMNTSALALAEKRLRASVLKWQLKISTPTLPGRGIHSEYIKSDQHVWEVNCESCDTWNELDFFRDVRLNNVDFDTYKYWEEEPKRRAKVVVLCPNCKMELDRLGEGRWTAKNPSASIRGYQIPSLCFPTVDLNEIAVNITSEDPEKVKEAYRSDLGLPYEISGSQVTEAMLLVLSVGLQNGKLPETTWSNATMGVDVGSKLHYRISSTGADGKRYIRAMGSVDTWGELSGLLDEFDIVRCVIDALPEQHKCKEWASLHPGRVFRAYYPNSANLKGSLFQPEAEKIEEIININRTMAMDTVYAHIAGRKEIFPAAIHNNPEVIAHLKAPIKVINKNKDGQDIAVWVHTSPDHLYHASVYDVIALKSLPKEKPGVVFSTGVATEPTESGLGMVL